MMRYFDEVNGARLQQSEGCGVKCSGFFVKLCRVLDVEGSQWRACLFGEDYLTYDSRQLEDEVFLLQLSASGDNPQLQFYDLLQRQSRASRLANRIMAYLCRSRGEDWFPTPQHCTAIFDVCK